MGQNRNCALDIAKAICIILMVIGHSGMPRLFASLYLYVPYALLFLYKWLSIER